MKAEVEVDGRRYYKGRLSCVLVGNVGKLFGGVEVFGDARPDDGVVEVGLVTADSPAQWARTFGRLAAGSPEKSPFVRGHARPQDPGQAQQESAVRAGRRGAQEGKEAAHQRASGLGQDLCSRRGKD